MFFYNESDQSPLRLEESFEGSYANLLMQKSISGVTQQVAQPSYANHSSLSNNGSQYLEVDAEPGGYHQILVTQSDLVSLQDPNEVNKSYSIRLWANFYDPNSTALLNIGFRIANLENETNQDDNISGINFITVSHHIAGSTYKVGTPASYSNIYTPAELRYQTNQWVQYRLDITKRDLPFIGVTAKAYYNLGQEEESWISIGEKNLQDDFYFQQPDRKYISLTLRNPDDSTTQTVGIDKLQVYITD